jgi:hypothetical protein
MRSVSILAPFTEWPAGHVSPILEIIVEQLFKEALSQHYRNLPKALDAIFSILLSFAFLIPLEMRDHLRRMRLNEKMSKATLEVRNSFCRFAIAWCIDDPDRLQDWFYRTVSFDDVMPLLFSGSTSDEIDAIQAVALGVTGLSFSDWAEKVVPVMSRLLSQSIDFSAIEKSILVQAAAGTIMSFGEPGLQYITKQMCVEIIDGLGELDDDSELLAKALDFFAEILGGDRVL